MMFTYEKQKNSHGFHLSKLRNIFERKYFVHSKKSVARILI